METFQLMYQPNFFFCDQYCWIYVYWLAWILEFVLKYALYKTLQVTYHSLNS